MSRYLFQVSYTPDGLKGLAKDGAAARPAAVETLVGGLGGSLVSFDFAFGDYDVYVIVDLPDDESAASIPLVVAASGAVSRFNTVKLLSIDQVDAALAKHPDYRPPGG